MKKFLDRVFQYKYFPIFLFLICLIAYGLLIPWLGSYSDDLSFLFYYRVLGKSGLLHLLQYERPIQGFVYSLTMPILGTSALAWQIFGLITHFLSAWALWFMLGRLWPEKQRQNAWVTALYAVFPGFMNHWLGLTSGHIFLMSAVTFCSIGFMLWSFSVKKHAIWLTAASLLTGAIGMVFSEYYYGLEFARVIFIYIIAVNLYPLIKDRFKFTLKKYIPYFIMQIVLLVWRFFIFESGKYNIQVAKAYGGGLPSIIWGLIKDIALGVYNAALLVWVKLFQILGTSFKGITDKLFWLVLIVSTLLVGVYFIFFREKISSANDEAKSRKNGWHLQAFILGFFSLIFLIAPFVAAGFKITLTFPNERFMFAFAFPACLLLVTLLDLHRFSRFIGAALVSIFLGLSIAWQFQEANVFRKALIIERDLFWQLSWRAPGLEPGTILMSKELDTPWYSENQLSSYLNLLYDPGLHSTEEKYVFAYTNGRIRDMLGTYKPNQPVSICDRRDLCLNGNTSDVIGFLYSPTSCLTMLDPVYTNINSTLPDFRKELEPVIPFSSLDRIITNPESPVIPASRDFGKEPAHDWCYFFEKADLARQVGDWKQVTNLWNQSQDRGYSPLQVPEYFPFIEAFGHLGNLEQAKALSLKILPIEPLYQQGICDIWNRVKLTAQLTADNINFIDATLQEMSCNK